MSNKVTTRIRRGLKQIYLSHYCLTSAVDESDIQRFCFFYLPEVPDFGEEFTYFKLGTEKTVVNPLNRHIVFEADQKENISRLNQHFMDYSGLYAILKNRLITKKYMMIIHYDTQILNPLWKRILRALLPDTTVFSTWPIDNERSDLSRWVYERIDEVSKDVFGETFLQSVLEHNIQRLPNSSQLTARTDFFYELMDYLMKVYDYILENDLQDFRYAHMLERFWGLYIAMNGYRVVRVIRDSHNQAGKDEPDNVPFGLLSEAQRTKSTSFCALLGR